MLPGQLESKWATVRGLAMHYRTSVEPEPSSDLAVVLVHGLAVSSRYMLPTAHHLTPHYRVYAPDLLGFGKSEKPAHIPDIVELADILAEWMQAVELPRAILLGNSLGCQIIANFALRHHERLELAILTGPTMDPQARTATQQILRWLANAPFEPLSLFPVVIRDFLDIGFRRFAVTFRHGLHDHIEEHLPHIQVPTLVIRGSRDTIVPQRWAEEVTQLLPRGKLQVFAKAAHDVNYNSPVDLTNALCSFTQKEFGTLDPTRLPLLRLEMPEPPH